jgi:hypothetical protein
MASKPAQTILFFYCYQCPDYELKTNPHYHNQKHRFARRSAEAPGSQCASVSEVDSPFVQKVGAMPNSNIAKITWRMLWQRILSSTPLTCAALPLLRTKSPNTRLIGDASPPAGGHALPAGCNSARSRATAAGHFRLTAKVDA